MIVTSENDTSIASSYQSAISTTRETKCKILACSRNNKINVVYVSFAIPKKLLASTLAMVQVF
jgi:hypothetical protein